MYLAYIAKKIKMHFLGRLKSKAYALFAKDINSALLNDERLKFEQLRQIDTEGKKGAARVFEYCFTCRVTAV